MLRASVVLVLFVALSPSAADVWTFDEPASTGYDAAALHDAYDAAGLHAAGIDGRGVRVGILTWGPADAAALDAYAAANGLPTGRLAHRPPKGPACVGPHLGEWDLDVQMVRAMAPRADIIVYCAPSPTYDALLGTLSVALLDDDIDVLSQSWGACELDVPAERAAQFNALYAQAHAQGIAVFSASGDAGSRDCTRRDAESAEVVAAWPATDPGLVSVGGTRLARAAGEAWTETVWNTCAPCPASAWSASGGAPSRIFAPPAWQPPGDGRRSADVAAVADRETGVLVRSEGRWVAMGGTSAAAPIWAGAWALVVQEVGRTGNAAPLLWGAPSSTFRDVTSGHNGDFAAAPGYDLPTGWGGLRAGALVDGVTVQFTENVMDVTRLSVAM